MLQILSNNYCVGMFDNSNGIPGIIGDLVHYTYLGIKIVVPILLILFGMIDLGKAITAKKEEDIKKYQNNVVKKIVLGVLVFLIAIIVEFVLGFVEPSNNDESPVKCALEIVRGKNNKNNSNVTSH